MSRKRWAIVAVCALMASALSVPSASADPHHNGQGQNGNGPGHNGNGQGGNGQGSNGQGGGEGHQIRRVLLLSIDGMHAVDYLNCVSAGTCPNLAALGQTGVNYLATSTSKPSDSFPGLTAIVSGGSPRTEGVFYDVAYDRSLDPPAATTGNGLIGAPGLCSPGVVTGTSTEYEEGIDIQKNDLNGGAPIGDGGVNSINPAFLVRDPNNNCNPVFPWNFPRTNTIFGVIHHAGGYTAWSDKHPAYSSVSGPGPTAGNLDDFYGPEINSLSMNFEAQNDIPVTFLNCSPNLPDQLSVGNGDDYTGSFQNIQCYDAIKVQAILNEIDGKTHNASGAAPVPNIFGMNFQAVSVGQKLVYSLGPEPSGYSNTGGYTDGMGTPSLSLAQEIAFVDKSIGLMVTELSKRGLLNSTMIVVTAKHGQSPIDPNRVLRIHGDVPTDKAPSTILGSTFIPDSELNQIGPTEDDVSLLWLKDSSQTEAAVSLLETDSPAIPQADNIAGIGQIFWGASILPLFNMPGLAPNDPRTPDIVITPNVGVIYTNHQAKVAEHGGFANDDTNVMLLVSNPNFSTKTVMSPVETMQVAPTILAALGLDPNQLQAVQQEGTQVLPGLRLGGGDQGDQQ